MAKELPPLSRFVALWRQHFATTGVVLANLVPVVGVFFFGWDAFMVVLLYWLENGVIGVFNVLKMTVAGSEMRLAGNIAAASDPGTDGSSDEPLPERETAQRESRRASQSLNVAKGCLVPFFIVHYFGFMAGHLIFILLLLGPGSPLTTHDGATFSSLFSFGFDAWGLASLVVALISLVIEHGYLFYTEYLRSGEYRRAVLPFQMFQPYPRIVVVHVAILFGAFMFALLSLPGFLVVILVLMKIGLELLTMRNGAKR